MTTDESLELEEALVLLLLREFRGHGVPGPVFPSASATLHATRQLEEALDATQPSHRPLLPWPDLVHFEVTTDAVTFARHVLAHIGAPPQMGELIIDLLNERATYDGVTYPVDLFALLFLDVLNRRSGWLSEMEIKNTEPRLGAEKRFDRLRRKLPPKLAKLIEAKPGRGYRLRKPVQT